MSIMGALAAGFFFFEILGHLLHLLMHQRWTGPLWRSHMAHHKLYPPRETLADDEYRTNGLHSAVFVYLTAGVVVASLLLLIFPWRLALPLGAEMLVMGWLNDTIHDASHVRGHWLQRFGWFHRIRAMHLVHHRNMRFNHGLLTTLPDRAAGTYHRAE